MIEVGLLGLGTVGIGVVELLESRKAEISKLLGEEITIKKILVRDTQKKREGILEKDSTLLTSNYDDILQDEHIKIIIEVTSDVEKSYGYIKQAMLKGKSVVTANKAVVSKYFEELSSLAKVQKVSFLYEASVGGGIPILKPLKEELILNKISEVQGILNGTCNYMLTKMFQEDLGYDEALRHAQELGYAEADPTADVEGHDTLRKLRILGTLSLQGKIEEEEIILHGIEKMTKFDVSQIQAMDSVVRLIGEVKETQVSKTHDENENNEENESIRNRGYTAMVMPTIVKKDSYFAQVELTDNAISFKGDAIGELKVQGPGAGKLPTADAVLRDVFDAALNLEQGRKQNPLGQRVLENNNDELKGSYYVRISDVSPEISSKIKDLEGLSDEVMSKEGNVVLITKETRLKKMMNILSSIGLQENQYFIAGMLK